MRERLKTTSLKMHVTIDDKNLILYESIATDEKRAVILIDLQTLTSVGEFLVDTSTLSDPNLKN